MKADGLVHHDHVDMPVGEAVKGYALYAVPVAPTPSAPEVPPAKASTKQDKGGE
jgi:hypothetical protein